MQYSKQQPLPRMYLFLKSRDARIIEFFFLGLNTYILALIILPPYSTSGFRLLIRILFQMTVTSINSIALIYEHKATRMVSAIGNVALMALITTALITHSDPNAGTYGLLCLLAAFVCWKINIRQQ